MASRPLQAAAWLNNLVTADCRDSSGPPLRLPLSADGWAGLWYFTLKAWLCTSTGSQTVLLYGCTLRLVGCRENRRCVACYRSYWTLQKRCFFFPDSVRRGEKYQVHFCPCLNRYWFRTCRDFPKMEALISGWIVLDRLLPVWPIYHSVQKGKMTQIRYINGCKWSYYLCLSFMVK